VEPSSSSETLQVGEQCVATAGSGEETQIGLVARADSRLAEESLFRRRAFESSVFLLSKAKALQLKSHPDAPRPETPTEPEPTPVPTPQAGSGEGPTPQPGPDGSKQATLRLVGDVPPEIWNRLGTKVLPKLRAGDGLRVGEEY